MDSRDNLHSIHDWALKHVPFIGIHGFDALVLQEKLFFPPFSLEIKVYPLNWPNLGSRNNLHSYGD